STPLTTPANCAFSLIGSAKLAPSEPESSSVAMYDESAAWPTLSMAGPSVGDCSDRAKALYREPSSHRSAAKEDRWLSVRRLTFSMGPVSCCSSSLIEASNETKYGSSSCSERFLLSGGNRVRAPLV